MSNRVSKYLWPKNLAGQLIALLLLALVAAQIASFVILSDEHRMAFVYAARQEVMSRTVSVVRLLRNTDPSLHPTITRAANSHRLKFEISPESAVGPDIEDEGFNLMLQRRLAKELSQEVEDVRVAVYEDDDEDDDDDNDDDDRSHRWNGENRWSGGESKFWRSDRGGMMHKRWRRRHLNRGMTISIATKTAGGQTAWLNVYSLMPATNPGAAVSSLITIAIMAVFLIVIVILMVRRVTRPLARLSASAERLGRGEDVGILPEQGPQDIRKATRAFNEMQQRLTRFVRDRTRILAAITHDLKTPITSLRIRAEMIEDDENRAKFLETLEEMQSLTESALDFARQEATSEEARTVDLIALAESVCADTADRGEDVRFVSSEFERLPYQCRPTALKRVFRNLIENAIRYGKRATLTVSTNNGDICLMVEDDGPGIPADQRDQIFEPFVRLEQSRSKETGGIGLGLAIARTIVRAHGGDITVSDSESGGASFSVSLPGQA
jgi:signal transduction histidine kinase